MSALYRIHTIRARRRGCTVAGALKVDEELRAVTSHASHCIVFPERVLPTEVTSGQVWRVEGSERCIAYARSGFEVKETRVEAARAELVRPSGEHIVQLMARSAQFAGVGETTARKLWDKYGENLYTLLDAGDRGAISEVVGDRLAVAVLAGWEAFAASDSIRWLHGVGIDIAVARKLLAVYGNDVRARIASDPYRVLALGMTWSGVDELAREHFGVAVEDPRRLCAAVEAEMFRLLDEGHMAAQPETIVDRVASRVGTQLCGEAMHMAEQRGVIEKHESLYTTLGAVVIERAIAQMLTERLGLAALCDEVEAASLIKQFEAERAAEIGVEFGLNRAQKDAVLSVASNAVLLITGGAGVGKTTVLRAVCHLLDAKGCNVQALALSGRAAKRLAEATGRKCSTIAGYLSNTANREQPDGTVLIVDEASMVDALLAFRLLHSMPPRGRIVFIGDPGQLPPVGPGLSLHAFDGSGLPQVELTEVKRFGGLIEATSKAFRTGEWPVLSEDTTEAVFAIDCPPAAVIQSVLELYLADPDNTQILTFNRNGPVSSKSINEAVQRALVGKRGSASAAARPPLKALNEEGELEYCGVRLLDKVICTRNLWDEGVQNGVSVRRTHLD